MYTLEQQVTTTWGNTQIPSVSNELRLSPITRNYICKLLRQVDATESARLMEFKVKLSEDGCAGLNEYLAELYPDQATLASTILQLDNLVYLHKELDTQNSTYLEYKEQINQIRLQIFQLLGFSPV